jgi:hypothetical protein
MSWDMITLRNYTCKVKLRDSRVHKAVNNTFGKLTADKTMHPQSRRKTRPIELIAKLLAHEGTQTLLSGLELKNLAN